MPKRHSFYNSHHLSKLAFPCWKSEPPYSQDRALACTRRTLSMRSNRGRRVLQVDDLHRTRERLGRSRYWSLASHSRAARPLALLIIRIALASGSAARVTRHSHRTRVRHSRSRYCSLLSQSRARAAQPLALFIKIFFTNFFTHW